MKISFSLKRLLLFGGVLVFLSTVLFFHVNSNTVGAEKKQDILKEKLANKLPVRIKIPRINIDAVIESVGLTSQGAMDVPVKPEDTAWFNLGIKPGEIGSAVIDGHSGYKNNKPAIFDNLYKLQKGDKIYIQDDEGKITVFVVQKLKTYTLNQNALDIFSSNDNKRHLNLITCSGSWSVTEKTHSNRLAVFADHE